MRSVSTWFSTALAISAILVASWVALTDTGEATSDLIWPLGLLATTGVAFVSMMLAWALGRGRAVVAPVILRFDTLLLVIGLAFATGLIDVGGVGGKWELGVGWWSVIVLAILTFCLGWISVAIGRNRFIGFRTPRTLADDRIWQHANRVFGQALMWASPISLFGLLADSYGPIVALAPVLLIGIAFLWWDARSRR